MTPGYNVSMGNLIMGPDDSKRETTLTLLGLQKKVAEARCPRVNSFGDFEDHLTGCDCQGTFLRWPSLSIPAPLGNPSAGRMPNVTAERVLELLVRDERTVNVEIGYAAASRRYWVRSHPRTYHVTGDSMEDAVCKALLETQ